MTGFQKATRTQAKARIALAGPSGSGKTLTALKIARGLVGPDGRIAVIDTEKNSASLYADEFDFDTLAFDPPFKPQRYIKAIELAEESGYDVVIIDSISHEWNGVGGCQEMVDEAMRRLRTTNSMMGWKEVTPLHNAFVDKLVRIDAHLIATVRSKTAYEIDRNDKGQTTVKKLGLAPVQRDGLEYEFTIFADIDLNHSMTVTKSRMRALQDKTIYQPDESVGRKVAAWLGSAEAEQKPRTERVSTEDAPATTSPGDGDPNAAPSEQSAQAERKDEGVSPESEQQSLDGGEGQSGARPDTQTAVQDPSYYVSMIDDALEAKLIRLGDVVRVSSPLVVQDGVKPVQTRDDISELPVGILVIITEKLKLQERMAVTA